MLMKRVWGHLLAGVSLVVGGGAVIAACKHDDSTLFVQGVLAAQPVSAGAQCIFTSDPTQPFISSGVLDIAFRNEYDPTFLVGNQAVAEVNSQQLQTETDIITVEGATVRITDASGVQLNYYTRLCSGTIYPSSGSVPGYAPITVTALDSNTIQLDTDLQNNVVAGGTTRLVSYVQFFGQTTGGNSIQSDTFEFPIDVCESTADHPCLVGFSATSDDPNPDLPQPNCAGAVASSSSLPAPCVPGQDFTVDCSLCQSVAACHGADTSGTVVPDAGAD
jgi:hypothetical protein